MEFNLKDADGTDPYAPASLTLTGDDGENSVTYDLTEEKDGDFYIYTTNAPAPVPVVEPPLEVKEETKSEVQDQTVSDDSGTV